MYPIFRAALFRLEPEQAHALTLEMMRLAGRVLPVNTLLRAWFRTPARPVNAFGLRFANPVGLAAGYDKDGLGWRGLAALGFGHIEVGTVTLLPQPGNPRPRLFRLPDDKALINRLGFPGLGSDFVARRLSSPRPKDLILGVNLGKNKDTPLEAAADDYLALMEIFAPLSDYLAINVSSPNTVGLRRLQARQALEELLAPIVQRRAILEQSLQRKIPLLVKLAPDLSDAELEDALQAILSAGLEGVIATNTTLSRDGLGASPQAQESGGLSGAPLTRRSLEMVKKIVKISGGSLPVIAAGGIMGPADAQARLDAGACLVQIYTGLIYAGPGLVRQIITGLKEY